ncbi:hypothetical protein LSAT2_015702 [Lamellibrachia satsuma]|nr:hypothetical protein LSAT2_015702 [Lamellibrachia satsuma]
MEGGIYVIISLLVSLCVVGNIECNEAQPEYRIEDQQKYSEGDYMYYSYNNEHPQILCYSCRFKNRDGHVSGMPGCGKSFVKAGIPTVSCQGPCSTIYQKVNEKQFLITRNCVPSCKELRSQIGTIECCHTTLCNAGTRNYVPSSKERRTENGTVECSNTTLCNAGSCRLQATSCVVITVLCTLVALIMRR